MLREFRTLGITALALVAIGAGGCASLDSDTDMGDEHDSKTTRTSMMKDAEPAWSAEDAKADTHAYYQTSLGKAAADEIDFSYITPELIKTYADAREVTPPRGVSQAAGGYVYYGHHHVVESADDGSLVHYYMNDNPAGAPDRESDLCFGSTAWRNPYITGYLPGRDCKTVGAPGQNSKTVRAR